MSQRTEPRNRKFGVGFYYATMIITVIVMIGALIFIKNDDPEVLSHYRYMVAYYTLGGFLSSGLVVREFFAEVYDTKKWIIKIIVIVLAMAIGTVIFIMFKKAIYGLVLMLVGFGVLLYTSVPTIPRNNQEIK